MRKTSSKKMAEIHLATHATLKGVDLETPVYTESGWRIREIIGHIATWNQHVAISINKYREGLEYLIPDLDETKDDYNQKAVLEQQKLSAQQILAEWEQAYDEFKNAIQGIQADRFHGDMLYPWGDERGSITKLVE
jgi:hypothetical protein